jgi:uncharacterized protein (DUF1330 family)
LKTNHKIAIALTAGFVIGGAAIQGLHAQATPPIYGVTEITEITDPEGFKALTANTKGPEALVAFGGKYIVRTNNITAVEGTPPKRLIITVFDSLEKAKAWSTSPTEKEIDAMRMKATKSSRFFVEGM